MGGVGDEAALELKRALEACQQVIEGVCHLLQLVVRAGQVDTLVQVSGGDLLGGRRDGAHWPQERPARSQPTTIVTTAISASAIPETMSSCFRSEECWVTPP